MKIKALCKLIRYKLKGSLSVAVEEGMRVGTGVSVMGSVNFGSEPYLISLGNNVRISSNVTFITHDGGTWAFRNYYDGEFQDTLKFGRIEVGNGTFIGSGSTILPGVKIGHHAVVGAGSIVTKDIPDETVWAGVPAKQICSLLEYAQKSKAAFPADFDMDAYHKDKKQYLIKYYMDDHE